jgi:hypothetical protein
MVSLLLPEQTNSFLKVTEATSHLSICHYSYKLMVTLSDKRHGMQTIMCQTKINNNKEFIFFQCQTKRHIAKEEVPIHNI